MGVGLEEDYGDIGEGLKGCCEGWEVEGVGFGVEVGDWGWFYGGGFEDVRVVYFSKLVFLCLLSFSQNVLLKEMEVVSLGRLTPALLWEEYLSWSAFLPWSVVVS